MITTEQREKMCDLMGTMTDKAVGKAVGISWHKVYYYRKLLGVPACGNPKWNEQTIGELISYNATHSIEQCAEHFGLTPGSMRYTMSRLRKQGHFIPYV